MARKKRELFDELTEGLESMRAHREGKLTLRTHHVAPRCPRNIDADTIRGTRENFRMSRAVFARKLGISTRTLERWEQGRSKPNEQAATLLLLVRRYPETLDRLEHLGD